MAARVCGPADGGRRFARGRLEWPLEWNHSESGQTTTVNINGGNLMS